MRRFQRIWLLGLLGALACATEAGPAARQNDVRDPIGPGQFYPREKSVLTAAVEAMLKDAVPVRPETPVALVVPHAGYIYSGQIAADAYRQVAGRKYDTVVILGTNHTSGEFGRAGVYGGLGFRTPLGVAPVDREFVAALLKEDRDIVLNDAVHASEHSVEVQVPFIQHLFPSARIVPIVVGVPDPDLCARLGRALARVAAGRSVLIVASSDLSHYPAAAAAADADRRTLEAIASLQPATLQRVTTDQLNRGVPELLTCACGIGPILAAMHAATALGATRGIVLSYANSGDTAMGESARVVGYGAVMFTAAPGAPDTTALARPVASRDRLQDSDKRALLALARESIRRYLATQTAPLARGFDARALRQQGAFVTLRKGGELRGCIGQMTGEGPLARLVGAMALQAAFNDPRFQPLSAGELSQIDIEISVLTPPAAVAGPEAIQAGRDGVVLRKDGRSAVFLPQVATEQGWDRAEMLDNLAIKAGLPASAWRAGASFSTFQAEVFDERQFKGQ